MSTAQSCRYLLAAGVAFVGIGMLMEGIVLTGVFFLAAAVLLLPILYQALYIDSKEVQLLSPTVFLVVAIFSLAMDIVVPTPYTIPPQVVYSDTVAQTSASASTTTKPTTATTTTVTVTVTATQTPSAVATEASTHVVTTQTTVTQTTVGTVSTVYRTPSGKRYHYDADCGGENSYEVSLEEAESAGLTPCKKCAGG